MTLHCCAALAVIICAGCGKTNSPSHEAVAAGATPESAYRQLFLAILAGDEKTGRELIVDDSDADILWKGGYPKEVALLLDEQYRTMEIAREDGGTTDRVNLNSSAFPLPLTATKIDGSWKVDAEPLIRLRRAAEAVTPATR